MHIRREVNLTTSMNGNDNKGHPIQLGVAFTPVIHRPTYSTAESTSFSHPGCRATIQQ